MNAHCNHLTEKFIESALTPLLFEGGQKDLVEDPLDAPVLGRCGTPELFQGFIRHAKRVGLVFGLLFSTGSGSLSLDWWRE